MEHMEEILNCPVCNHNQFSKHLNCKDHTVSGEQFAILICNSCGFLFTNPRPDKTRIGHYYKSEAYISHSDTSKGLLNALYKAVRRLTLASKYRLIKPYLIDEPTLLDIGAGTGYFLKYCKDKGVYVSGIEPDPDARAAAQRLHGIALKTEQSLKEFNAASFSVITLWHVLEHLHDLNDNISSIKRLLKDSGKLIVAVPNHTSYDAQYYKEYWAAYDVPRHLYHFNPESIGRLFEKHGFVLETTKPMKWDAYYVSMLSEKYKSGSTNYLNSFFRAFVSNARAHHSRFSSQIYILSKNRI